MLHEALQIGRLKSVLKNGVQYISPEFFRPAEVDILCGDFRKAEEKLGWKPQTKFEKLVEIMMEADLRRISSK